MNRFIIGRPVLPHAPEHLQPTLAQTAEGTGMTVSTFAFGLIVQLSPEAGLAALIGPQMDGVAQKIIAGPPDARFTELARFKAHGAGTRATAQTVGIREHLALAPQLGQQSRRQFVLGAGQASKDAMIGMAFEGRSNALPIDRKSTRLNSSHSQISYAVF